MTETVPSIYEAPKLKWTHSFLIIFVIASLVLSLRMGNALSDYRQMGMANDRLWQAFVWEATSIYVMGALIPLVFMFVKSFPMTKSSWKQLVPLYLFASVVYSLMHVVSMGFLRTSIAHLMGDSYSFWGLMGEFPYELSKDIPSFASLAFAGMAFYYLQETRNAQMNALALEAKVAELSLSRLREQLRPHFLFNSLNLISSTMYEDVEKADKLLADLGQLLRHSLNESNSHTVTLRDEIEFLKLYSHIYNERFSGCLHTRIDIEPGCESAVIPRYLLQPLVENAVKHGFDKQINQGEILIKAHKQGSRLLLSVKDNGRGLTVPVDDALNKGFGLGQVKQTLELLYAGDHVLELLPGHQGGLDVRIEIPFLTQEELM